MTPVDWDGDENPKRAARFSTSSNIRGDHPLNLLATTLATQAYLLTHEAKYKRWVLEYVDAWRDRAATNGGNFPSNIGLDGKIGGEWGGKWYGGIFGWNSPDDGLRNYVLRGMPAAFGQAAMLSRNMAYIDPVRRQVDNIFAAARTENGRGSAVPHYYGESPRQARGRQAARLAGTDTGKASFFPTGALGNLSETTIELYLWSLNPADVKRILPNPPDRRHVQGWIEFLQGRRPNYPLEAMQHERQDVRERAAAHAARRPADTARVLSRSSRSPTSRWARPTCTARETCFAARCGISIPNVAGRVLPQDVAALVEKIEPEQRDADARQYQHLGVAAADRADGRVRRASGDLRACGRSDDHQVNAPHFEVQLAAGAGEQIVIAIKTPGERSHASVSVGTQPVSRGVSSMVRQRVSFSICVLIAGGLAFEPGPLRGQSDLVIPISKLMPAPAWALAERRLLALNAEGVDVWASKYLDENGHLRGAANFGIEDGPDDAVESIRNWPLAHALGGPDSIIEQWDRAWEGHLDQYTKAKDPSTELAKDGMYYKEFPTAV